MMYMWVGRGVSPEACQQLFNVPHYNALPPIQGQQLTHLVCGLGPRIGARPEERGEGKVMALEPSKPFADNEIKPR